MKKLLLAVALLLGLTGTALAAPPIPVNATTWTLLASAGSTVQVQNLSSAAIRLSVSASPPSTLFDGEVLSLPNDTRRYDAALPYNLYALALGSSGANVAVNPIGAGGKGSLANPDVVTDPNNAAFQGVVAMTVGTTYAAQRSLGANCTAAGNVSVTFTDASTFVVPVVAGFQTFPFAVTAVNSSGTTATCTYANLK